MSIDAVVYAADLPRMTDFYRAVLALTVTHAESDHVVLASQSGALTLVEIPAHIAATFTISEPPERRDDQAIKLSFPVASLRAARELAAEYGGVIDPADREWQYATSRVCDGHDPEGNVLQVRESAT